MPPTTFADLLQQRLRRTPGLPLVTYYDEATGERTELSVTSYANWVAKTAGVLTDELDLAASERLRVELGAHWLAPVFLGAALVAGLVLTERGPAALRVTGPPAPVSPSGSHSEGPSGLLVCSLHPFALPLAAELPTGALDFGHLWPNQPDQFLGAPATVADGGLELDEIQGPTSVVTWSQGELVGAALAAPSDDRLLTDLGAGAGPGVRVFLSALAGTGSLVWVAPPRAEEPVDPRRLAHLAEVEHATLRDRDHPGAVALPAQVIAAESLPEELP